ncbi:MAG: hypothetical protein JWN67_3923 [Actinomycetia bacterium]|nr:hypothetical protein [Actinomycetes bacterium]
MKRSRMVIRLAVVVAAFAGGAFALAATWPTTRGAPTELHAARAAQATAPPDSAAPASFQRFSSERGGITVALGHLPKGFEKTTSTSTEAAGAVTDGKFADVVPEAPGIHTFEFGRPQDGLVGPRLTVAVVPPTVFDPHHLTSDVQAGRSKPFERPDGRTATYRMVDEQWQSITIAWDGGRTVFVNARGLSYDELAAIAADLELEEAR